MLMVCFIRLIVFFENLNIKKELRFNVPIAADGLKEKPG